MYICKVCGYKSLKWQGKCPNCNSWDTFFQEKELKNQDYKDRLFSLDEITLDNLTYIKGFKPFDDLIGNGIVKQSLILIGGNPGVGKSTLLLQIIHNIKTEKILYIAGEESKNQIKHRYLRLFKDINKNISILESRQLNEIIEVIKRENFSLVIVDSIQTIYDETINSTAGSISQITKTLTEFINLVKYKNKTFIITAHITKEGNIAGPKTLEHMVDVVLYLNYTKNNNLRYIQIAKNRFSTIDKVAYFFMSEKGLEYVKDLYFTYQNKADIISCILDNNLAIITEIQSLVVKSSPFGPSKRIVNSIEVNKLHLIIAVINKYLNLKLNEYDIYLNIPNPNKIKDNAIDMAIAASLLANYYNKKLKNTTFFLGEIDLYGNLREVPASEIRIQRAKKFTKNIITFNEIKNIKQLKDFIISL